MYFQIQIRIQLLVFIFLPPLPPFPLLIVPHVTWQKDLRDVDR